MPSASASPGWSTATACCASARTCRASSTSRSATASHERLGMPVAVDNDATRRRGASCGVGAARGRRRRAAGGARHRHRRPASCAGGVLQRGANGFAGEAGHMVVDPDGPGLPVRPAGLLGAVRLGLGPGPPRPRRRRRRPGAGVVALAGGDPEAVRGEHVTTAAGDRRRRRPGGARRVRLVGGARRRQPGERARPRGRGDRRRAGRDGRPAARPGARALRRRSCWPRTTGPRCRSWRPRWASGPARSAPPSSPPTPWGSCYPQRHGTLALERGATSVGGRRERQRDPRSRVG